MIEIKDVIIIGGGVVGCAVARLLSQYKIDITLLEAKSDVAEGESKANSAIVHGGYDALPGTLKAKLNIKGTNLFPGLCKELGVPYVNNGSMVLCFSEEDRPVVQKLYNQGIENGVPGLRIIEKEEILKLEPATNPEVVCALLVTNSGITSPYELTYALADHAAVNGVEFRMNSRVCRIERENTGLFLITLEEGCQLRTKILVNCAGTESADLHNMLSDRKYEIIPRRGEYYLLDHQDKAVFNHTMFHLPTELGKGILVSPTVHGNLLLGPTADEVTDDEDTKTTAEALKKVRESVKIIWPKENLKPVITTFAGIRAHEKDGDFIVGLTEGQVNAYETVGIESPGLSAAPAIAEYLVDIIAKEQFLYKKETWLPPEKREKPFNQMSLKERAEAAEKDPEYGAIVCRCEEVTEAEIRQAINRPVGATTIDGIKRRTRAGMGRCQGGFCSPRVLEILSEELGISPLEVTKNGKGSHILAGKLFEDED